MRTKINCPHEFAIQLNCLVKKKNKGDGQKIQKINQFPKFLDNFKQPKYFPENLLFLDHFLGIRHFLIKKKISCDPSILSHYIFLIHTFNHFYNRFTPQIDWIQLCLYFGLFELNSCGKIFFFVFSPGPQLNNVEVKSWENTV